MINNQHNNDLFILSAYTTGTTDEGNQAKHKLLKESLTAQGVQFAEVDGQFDGKHEKSFILSGTKKLVAHHYATIYNQDCFIRLEPHKNNMYKAYFIDTISGVESFAGYFRSARREIIEALELDFTRDVNGTYFTVWSHDHEIPDYLDKKLLDRMERGDK